MSSASPHTSIVGTKCTKMGSTRTLAGVRYQCVKSAGVLKWKRLTSNSSSVTATTSPTTSTTQPRPSAAEVVASRINSFVAQMRSRNQAVPSIEYRFAPNVSEDDRLMTRQLAEGFFKFGSFPQLAGYRNAISVSLSNADAVETTALWMNVAGWGNIAGGYTGTGVMSAARAGLDLEHLDEHVEIAFNPRGDDLLTRGDDGLYRILVGRGTNPGEPPQPMPVAFTFLARKV